MTRQTSLVIYTIIMGVRVVVFNTTPIPSIIQDNSTSEDKNK
jgi:hypothetical protein